METSILTSTKKLLGLAEDHTEFDLDVITHINSVFSDLTQMGIGSASGFAISDDTAVWEDYIEEDLELSSVKTYVFLRVRLLFDPPTTSYLMTSMKEQIEKAEFRLNVVQEGREWEDPNPQPETDVLA